MLSQMFYLQATTSGAISATAVVGVLIPTEGRTRNSMVCFVILYYILCNVSLSRVENFISQVVTIVVFNTRPYYS